MTNDKLIKTGIIGSAVMILCCFTPVLIIAFGAVGLGGYVAGLDYILIPGMLGFMALTGFALYRRARI